MPRKKIPRGVTRPTWEDMMLGDKQQEMCDKLLNDLIIDDNAGEEASIHGDSDEAYGERDEARDAYHQDSDIKTMFRMMCDHINQNFDKVLSETHLLREELSVIKHEIVAIKDTQKGLITHIQELSDNIITGFSINGEIQSELFSMKQELSVCSAAVMKINSGLTHLVSKGVPIGKLPISSNYTSQEKNASKSEECEEDKTPLKVDKAQLLALLIQAGLSEQEAIGGIGLLNNRTAHYFGANLGQVFPGLEKKHPLAGELLSMGSVTTKEKIAEMISLLLKLQKSQKVKAATPIDVSHFEGASASSPVPTVPTRRDKRNLVDF